MYYVVYSQNAGSYVGGTPVVKATAKTRAELEPVIEHLRETASISTVLWIERIDRTAV
jgi:hypothetical protein